MKITFAMNVLNGEPFIWYQLKSIYKHAHEIVIVEGAYEKFSHAAKGYRSYDNTIELIKNYPDPDGKIKLIARDYFYDDRVGMCNEFMEEVTGDVLWQVDVDEFYSDETYHYVRELFKNDVELDQVEFNFIDYYGGFEYEIHGYDPSLLSVIRVNRFFTGMKWASQRPPTLELNGKMHTPRNIISGKQMQEKGHLMHNATMLFDTQVRDKFKYYSNMWPMGVTGGYDWFEASWKKFEIKFCVAGMLNALTYVVPSTAALPEGLKQMKCDINSRKWIGYEFSSKKIQSKISQDEEYDKKIITAKAINKIKTSSPADFMSLTISTLVSLLSLSRSRDKSFMGYIFLKSIVKRPYYAFRHAFKTISSAIFLRK